MADSDFQQQNTGSDILASYAKATRFSPISETKKNQVLKDYGITAGWAKGKEDSAISNEAAAKVLAKFKTDQAKTQPKPAAATALMKPADVDKLLQQRGLPGTSPPDYARVNVKELNAWIDRTLRRSQLTTASAMKMLAAGGFPNARPPDYALVSTWALQAWIKRAQRYAASR